MKNVIFITRLFFHVYSPPKSSFVSKKPNPVRMTHLPLVK